MNTSKPNFSKYAAVILDVSIDKTLDYGIPDHLLDKAKRGVRVHVPVKGFLRPGYILSIKETADYPRVLPIDRLVFDEELIPDDLFELALWMAKYYCAPLRKVLKMIVPSGVRKEMKHKQQLFVMRAKTREELKTVCESIRNKFPAQAEVLDVMLGVRKGILLTELLEETGGSRSPVDALAKKGLLILDIVRIDRSPLINEEYFQTKPKLLNLEQQQALEKIARTMTQGIFETHLLHGVTGSGKTEVYLQAIDQALKNNRGTIMLVPEISLTAQTIERFRSRFEGHIAILHHRLSDGERFDEWHRIRRGDAQIVIGARSAIFSPLANLGLIIVDEEHENTYKQQDNTPAYHARDVAVMRGKLNQAAVILGSATPSLESYSNAINGKYHLSQLKARADSAAIPHVTIVDMKTEFEKAKGFTNFSDVLLESIKKRMASGEQTILLLNRRGYHTTLFCQQCREAVGCPHCDVSLTFHLGENTLSCHLCGFSHSPPPKLCPKCKTANPMKFRGVGTELVQKSLHAILPEVRTIRMDADTTRHKGSHHRLLREFGAGKADVLIGTQMIAKGLHFPSVTLVGVLNSDSGINIPDFRASETAFQLITQVAGRAGRGAMAGEVIIQTCMPDNSTIKLASQQDYEGFYKEEIQTREMFQYPPFCQLAKIAFSGLNQAETLAVAKKVRNFLTKCLSEGFRIHPIIPAGHAKVKDRYRFQFLILGPSIYPIGRAIEAMRGQIELSPDIKMFVDINPSSTYF